MNTVKEYRQNGYKVRVTHFRFDPQHSDLIRYSRKTKHLDVHHNGGLTKIEVRDPQGNEVSAEAKCNIKDMFNYSIGTRIALGRAIKQLTK
jgi:hypothetical protein